MKAAVAMWYRNSAFLLPVGLFLPLPYAFWGPVLPQVNCRLLHQASTCLWDRQLAPACWLPLCLPQRSNTGKGSSLFPQGRDTAGWAFLFCVSLVLCVLWGGGNWCKSCLMTTIITVITWMQNTVSGCIWPC